MSFLLLLLIVIGLGAILALSQIFLGGEKYVNGFVESEASRYRNEALMISGAVKLYKVDGKEINDDFQLQTLVDQDYLQYLPEGWEPTSSTIMKTIGKDESSEQICFTSNSQAGFVFEASEFETKTYSGDANYAIPYCDKADLDSTVPCCIIIQETEETAA